MAWLIGLMGCALVALAAIVWYTLSKPDVILLLPEKGAEWVRFEEPLDLRARDMGLRKVSFRRTFEVREVPREAPLFFKALKFADVLVNGASLFSTGTSEVTWRETYRVNLADSLIEGENVLRIDVFTSSGNHPAVLAYAPALNLSTPDGWEASKDEEGWTPVLPVTASRHFPLSREFQRADKALLSKAFVFAPLFLAVFAIAFILSRRKGAFPGSLRPPSPGILRWILIAAWTGLAVNNIGKVPLYLGMDLTGHLEYIRYIVERGKLPLAPEGYKLAEPPLYYMLSAAIYSIASQFFSLEWVYRILRVLPLLCGIVQVELCHRALRHVYPDRADLQRLGLIVGGLLPMNLYICQVVGNEPLTGCLTAIVVVWGLRLIEADEVFSIRTYAGLGVVLGLALLTKLTPVLMIAPLVLFLFIAHASKQGRGGSSMSRIEVRITAMLLAALVVAGWFYLRNKIDLGKFVVSGWDPENGFPWWQDPGMRTLSQFIRFGESLFYPVDSSLQGVWDSLYSTFWADGSLSGSLSRDFGPNWNFGFMLSGVWLSIVPALGIAAGIVFALKRVARPGGLGLGFAAICVLLYIGAVVYLFLILPVYSTGKATYTSGLTPCYAILCATGFGLVLRRRFLRSVLFGLLACWAVCVFAAFFVVDTPHDGRSEYFLGELLAEEGRVDEAVHYYTRAIDANPKFAEAYNGLGSQLVRQGKFKDAIRRFEEALVISPEDPGVLNNLGATMLYMNRTGEARKCFEEAIRLRPDYEKAKQNLKRVDERVKQEGEKEREPR